VTPIGGGAASCPWTQKAKQPYAIATKDGPRDHGRHHGLPRCRRPLHNEFADKAAAVDREMTDVRSRL